MADSVDRVFVHALNTVKKIPRTGSPRPPPADRLRLYGLYKQAMEGDVDGVMERPEGSTDGNKDDSEIIKEQEKWDAWDAQKGISRTEAKRRYIEALIDTMHNYASTTADGRELVAELEFVWDQIKNNSISSSNSSPGRRAIPAYTETRRFQQPLSGDDGPMKVLSPMSQDDESEAARQILEKDNDAYENEFGSSGESKRKSQKWRKSVEAAMVKMTAEMAALREKIESGREWRGKRRRTIGAWLGWLAWAGFRQLFIDALLLAILLLWMRKKKDRRLEDLVRAAFSKGREIARRYLPER